MKRYPLEHLERLRKERRDDAAEALAERARVTEAQEAKVRGLEQSQCELALRATRERDGEHHRAQTEGARAVDFQRLDAHQLELANERRALHRAQLLEQRELDAARSLEETARAGLALSAAEHRTVLRHRAAFETSERARTEKREEEDALLVHEARSRG